METLGITKQKLSNCPQCGGFRRWESEELECTTLDREIVIRQWWQGWVCAKCGENEFVEPDDGFFCGEY